MRISADILRPLSLDVGPESHRFVLDINTDLDTNWVTFVEAPPMPQSYLWMVAGYMLAHAAGVASPATVDLDLGSLPWVTTPFRKEV